MFFKILFSSLIAIALVSLGGTARSQTVSAGLMKASNQLDDTTLLRVGDIVSYRVLEDDEAPVLLTVNDSGQIQVPYLGSFTVLNKTPRMIAAEIRQGLESSVYRKATVLVSLETKSGRSPGRVFVTGEVNHQASLELRPNQELTLMQAIVEAGGFTDFANKRKVRVIRKTGGVSKPTVVDAMKIINQGRTDLDITLQPGDVVLVPVRLINF
jgi:polysaccharide export outer membrane protein